MSKGRTFDKVEKKMNHIQASLSRTSLITPERSLDDRMVTRLKSELEEKELLAKKYKKILLYIAVTLCLLRLQEQLKGLKSKPLESDPDLSGLEEQLRTKRKQIKKKKEELQRIQDNG